MKPALTAQEWKQETFTRGDPDNVHITRRGGVIELDLQHSGAHGTPSPETRHAIAALMLDGQPFGFTRGDVQLLTWSDRHTVEGSEADEIIKAKRKALAARIEALLIPELK